MLELDIEDALRLQRCGLRREGAMVRMKRRRVRIRDIRGRMRMMWRVMKTRRRGITMREDEDHREVRRW